MKPLVVLLTAILIATSAHASSSDQSRAAAAAFAEFETVVGANADASSSLAASRPRSGSDAALDVPFEYLISGLDALKSHARSEILGTSDSVVMGGKGFVPPNGVGGFQISDYCYIVNFAKRNSPQLKKYFDGPPVASLPGEVPVWTWDTDLHYETPRPKITFYATRLGPYLLFASSLDELRVMARKLTSADDPSKTLNGIREWASVSRYDYWAYRKPPYGRGANSDGLGLDRLLSDTEICIFYADTKNRSAVLQIFERANRDPYAPNIPPSLKLLSFKPRVDGGLEAGFALSEQQVTAGQIFAALSLFGFEIVI